MFEGELLFTVDVLVPFTVWKQGRCVLFACRYLRRRPGIARSV